MTTRRRAALASAALLLAASLSACATPNEPVAAAGTPNEPASATEITVTHAQGETEVPVNPSKVLTFDLASLGTLDTLGVDVLGVPKSNLPGELAKYADEKYLDIGTLFEPDYEAVNAAEPDLIIVTSRSAEALPELAKIAPTIDLSNDWTDFYGSNLANTRTLGQIFD